MVAIDLRLSVSCLTITVGFPRTITRFHVNFKLIYLMSGFFTFNNLKIIREQYTTVAACNGVILKVDISCPLFILQSRILFLCSLIYLLFCLAFHPIMPDVQTVFDNKQTIKYGAKKTVDLIGLSVINSVLFLCR